MHDDLNGRHPGPPSDPSPPPEKAGDDTQGSPVVWTWQMVTLTCTMTVAGLASVVLLIWHGVGIRTACWVTLAFEGSIGMFVVAASPRAVNALWRRLAHAWVAFLRGGL